jgi:hypothetical protein
MFGCTIPVKVNSEEKRKGVYGCTIPVKVNNEGIERECMVARSLLR